VNEKHTITRKIKRHKSAFQRTIEDFSLVWFAIPMNKGILGIPTHQIPYQFRGLQVLSTIMYIFDIVQFKTCSVMTYSFAIMHTKSRLA